MKNAGAVFLQSASSTDGSARWAIENIENTTIIQSAHLRLVSAILVETIELTAASVEINISTEIIPAVDFPEAEIIPKSSPSRIIATLR
jgi:hypothetical protein